MFHNFAPHLPGFAEVLEDRAGLLQRAHPIVGSRWSRDYRRLMEEALRWMDLPEAARARLAQYVYDLFQWGGPTYARRYVTRLWGVYRKDQKERGWQATLAVMDNLHRVMAIKDEVYVAHLLTGEEKHRRDRARYNVNEERGDRLDYVHLNRPNFTVMGRNIQFDWRSRQWQLRIMKHLRFLRRLLPGWHAAERSFLTWYEFLVDDFNLFADGETYRLYTELLSLPAEVRGYREIRAPKMDVARARAQSLLIRVRERNASLSPLSVPRS
jgi:indolepyruvate ferredoxin oxidoreductase